MFACKIIVVGRASAIVLDDVADFRRMLGDLEGAELPGVAKSIVNRLVDKLRMVFGELELGGCRPGLIYAPTHKNSSPRDCCATGEAKAKIGPIELDLMAQFWIVFGQPAKFGMLIQSDIGEIICECGWQ